jgi:hypothetical protein
MALSFQVGQATRRAGLVFLTTEGKRPAYAGKLAKFKLQVPL